MKSALAIKFLSTVPLVKSQSSSLPDFRISNNRPSRITSHSPSNNTDPKLSECLLSATTKDDCGIAVQGCIWCAEPVYGLCLTESAAKKVDWMPFFTCIFPAEGVSQSAQVEKNVDVDYV